MSATAQWRLWPLGAAFATLAGATWLVQAGLLPAAAFRALIFEGPIGLIGGAALGASWRALAPWRIVLLAMCGGALNRVAVDAALGLAGLAQEIGLAWMSGPALMSALSAAAFLAIANGLCHRRTRLPALLGVIAGALAALALFVALRTLSGGYAAWQFALNWGLWLLAVAIAHLLSPARPGASRLT